jgi:hypothetical protein
VILGYDFKIAKGTNHGEKSFKIVHLEKDKPKMEVQLREESKISVRKKHGESK